MPSAWPRDRQPGGRRVGSVRAAAAGRHRQDKRHLVVVATSDRGLAGGFNSTIVRAAREKIAALLAEGKDVKIITIGRKARDQLRAPMATASSRATRSASRRPASPWSSRSRSKMLELYTAGEFDVVTLIYSPLQVGGDPDPDACSS